MTYQPLKHNRRNQTTLYHIVYDVSYTRWLVGLLFIFFLLHPAIPAFAAEDDVVEEGPEEKVIDVIEKEEVSEPAPEVAVESADQEQVVEVVGEAEAVEETGVEVEENQVSDEEVFEETTEESYEASATQTAESAEADLTEETNDEISNIESDDSEEDTDEAKDAEATTTVEKIVTEVNFDDDVVGEFESEVGTSTGEFIEGGTELESSTTTATSTDGVVQSGGDNHTGGEQDNGSGNTEPITEETGSELDEQAVGTIVEDSYEGDESGTATSSLSDFLADTDTTTSTKATSTAETISVLATSDSDEYRFNKDSCRMMADGAFYCSEMEPPAAEIEDAVFAAPDSDGDLEIYVRIDGEESKVTDNQVDDSAPTYDALSNTLVWHSLINDRYQIMMLDLDTGKTIQLTDTSYNNMQPVAYGGTVFWQAWIENNWEIVRLEGDEVIQMTDNEVHDISPYAQDSYVMWQTQTADGWKTSLYDIESGEHQYIDADTDGVTKNPRLVLMYESYDANGDVKILGYDLKNKQYINLASVPTSMPAELPEPEGDTEEKALVQSKPALREHDEGNDDIDSKPDLDIASTTQKYDDDTIVIPATSTSAEMMTETVATSSVTAAEAELDRLIEEKMEARSTEHIEDIVIPPLATTTDEVVG